MINKIKQYFRSVIKKSFCLYDIEDLTIKGHCGCCGSPISDQIMEKYPHNWGICYSCGKRKNMFTPKQYKDENNRRGPKSFDIKTVRKMV